MKIFIKIRATIAQLEQLYLSLLHMREYSSALIIDILHRDYPEVENMIMQRIGDTIPQKLENLELLPLVINSFKSIKGIQHSGWMRVNDISSNEIIKNRNLLIAVLLLFFHPEKILKVTDRKVKSSLLRNTAIELNCTLGALKMSISTVIVAFRAYKEFKAETYRLYELIKTENKFFE